MKIARALKMIARMEGELAQKKLVLARCVSVLNENEFTADFKTELDSASALSESIISLRARVMAANVSCGLFIRILRLGQLKQGIDFMRKLDIKQGIVEQAYGGSRSAYKTQLTEAERDKLVKEFQKLIEAEIDALDSANATIEI